VLLSSGTHLGPYEITAKLGEGGMGEVYRARDTKLERDVAIKVLPAAFVEDHERLQRFEREAKLLAQLNHPNIAHIYGMEASGDSHALVMELVDGPTLAERLESGSLPVSESLSLARQIAEALEEAHEKGIIHRDLKPQNIKASIEGKVKVLDFGLAKAMDPTAATSGAGSPSQLAASPTLTLGATQMGVVLGTAAYMAPEQAKGFAVDRRCDIWAFGVVLFEMLTGKRLFEAPTVPETLAQVLTREPDLGALPASIPPAIRRLLRRCLERNPKNRLHDIADARIVIDDVSLGRDGEFAEAQAPASGARRSWLPWAVAAVGFAAALLTLFAARGANRPAEKPKLKRTSILVPGSVSPGGAEAGGMFALAPDGSAIAYAASGYVDIMEESLYVRELDQTEARKLPGTEGASYPFWSPDGKEIGFFAGGFLRRVPRGGGAARTICAAANGRGGSWSSNGTIVFAPGPYSALMRVSASGGEPVEATRLADGGKERSHRFPQFLPDGRHFLFGVEPWSTEMEVRVATLDEVTAGRQLLGTTAVPRFAAPDQLVFVRDEALLAQTIDLDRLAMAGEARQLDDRPNLVQTVTSQPAVDASSDGELLYAPVDPLPAVLVWYSRSGGRTETAARLQGGQFSMAVSHRGDRLAAMVNTTTADGSMWIVDAGSGDTARITSPDIQPWEAVWSWDDRQVASNIAGGGASASVGPGLITVESGEVRRVIPATNTWRQPTDLSSDGRVLIYTQLTSESDSNVGWLRLDGDPTPTNYVATAATEIGARLSPDRRYLAYLSNASGRTEVYVDTFPKPSRARRVETGGSARQIAFREDGKELFVLADLGGRATLFSFPLQPGPELGIGSPQKMFTLPPQWLAFAPSPKGDRFYTLERPGNRSPTLTLVENWRAQFEAKK